MTISYNLGIPDAPDNPSTDQPLMKVNNDNIATYVAVDHVAFNTTGSGKHNQVTFQNNNIPAIPTSPPVLFTTLVGSLPQLLWYSGDATHTANQYSIVSSPGSAVLLGGLIIKWGNFSISGGSNSSVPITFNNPFPSGFFALSLIPDTSTGTSNNVASFTRTGSGQAGFTAYRSGTSGTVTYFYIAIGN